MGSTFEDIEEGQRLMTKSLPIRYVNSEAKPKKGDVIEQVIGEMKLDVMQRTSRGITKEIVSECAKRGTDTTTGMVGYVLNKMRKEQAAGNHKRKSKARTKEVRKQTTQAAWQDPITQLEELFEELQKENQVLRDKLTRIQEVAK